MIALRFFILPLVFLLALPSEAKPIDIHAEPKQKTIKRPKKTKEIKRDKEKIKAKKSGLLNHWNSDPNGGPYFSFHLLSASLWFVDDHILSTANVEFSGGYRKWFARYLAMSFTIDLSLGTLRADSVPSEETYLSLGTTMHLELSDYTQNDSNIWPSPSWLYYFLFSTAQHFRHGDLPHGLVLKVGCGGSLGSWGRMQIIVETSFDSLLWNQDQWGHGFSLRMGINIS